jgi:UDP-N-acetyl-D-mannosaminuronate dehydrogenase
MHDPLCSGSEIKRLVKGVKILPHFSDKPLSVGAIILASDHSLYKYLKPSSVQLLCKKARLIIDNHGIWSRIMFSTKARYHQVGDGSLFLSK